MKLLKINLLAIVAIIIAAASLTSCGDEYATYNMIEGRWELTEVNGYYVSPRDANYSQFIFTVDRHDSWSGTGQYGQYNPMGQWYNSFISWEMDETYSGATLLYIYPNGAYTPWRYNVTIYGNFMQLVDLDTGDRLVYTAY